MPMDDVISVAAGSADAASGLSGNPTDGATELVAGADASAGGAENTEKRLRDLQSARDTATSKLTRAEREAQTLQQQLEETRAYNQQFTAVYGKALRFFLNHPECPDEETAEKWAQEDAQEYMDGLQKTKQVQQKAQKYDETQAEAQASESRKAMIADVLEETGLSREQLHAAVKHIKKNDPDVVNKFWRAAYKAAKALQTQQPNVENRSLVQQLGFPAAGTSAQGLATLPDRPPEGMHRGDPKWKAMIDAERARIRGV